MFRRRKDETFEAFFRAQFGRTVGVACRILGSRSAAEDVAAEAMARAYADWRNVAGLAHKDAWVLRVATNLALDAVRRKRPDPAPRQSIDVEELVTSRISLAAALASLPRRQREIVALRHLAGLSEAEVAGTLGLAPGTVKTHGHRALARLRLHLGDAALEGRLS